MAVGYERINTSAARSKRVSRDEIPRDKIIVVKSGLTVFSDDHGKGITLEEFVSDSDRVKCQFPSGVVIMRGREIRAAL